MLKVDPEIKSLIPQLTKEERQQLEANLVRDGCIDPVLAWKSESIIIDGHNRQEICERRGIPYQVVTIDFASRRDVIEWVILHQLGRRNITLAQRAKLALKLKPVVEAKNTERKKSGRKVPKTQKTDLPNNCSEGVEAKDDKGENETDNIVAKAAGISKRIVQEAEKIKAEATPKLKEAVDAGTVSIHAAAEATELPAEKQDEVADGKSVRQAKTEVATEKDALGRVVPENLAEVWNRAVLLDDAVAKIRSFKSMFGKLLPKDETPKGLAALATARKRIAESIRNIETLFCDARPLIVCTRCEGAGCGNCHTLGYVVRAHVKIHLKNAVADKVLTQEAADAVA